MDVATNDYVNVAFLMGVAHEADCRAVVSADLNNDGKQDLVLTEGQWMGGPHTGRNRLHIHLNHLPTTGHWIGARLSPLRQGVSPIGAKVRVKTADRVFPAQIVTADFCQSQNPFRAHFGLGPRTQVEEIVVEWPIGEVNRLTNPKVDAYYDFGRE